MTDRICISSQGKDNYHISAEDLTSCCWTCGMGCNGGFPESAWLVLIPLFQIVLFQLKVIHVLRNGEVLMGPLG